MARRPQSAFSFQMPRLMPGVRALIIALAVVSIGINAINAWASPALAGTLANLVVLHPVDIWRGHIWELFTFTFFEEQPISLLISGLMFWMFGTQLERLWGTRRFLFFYFAATALAGLVAALLGLVIHSVGQQPYAGPGSGLEALAAGFAISFATSTILAAFVFPMQARLLIPLSLGITLLYVVMTGSVLPFVVPVLALGAGVLLHGVHPPRNPWLRLRVLWFERRMRKSKLRVVPGLPTDDQLPSPRSGSRGSDEFLH